METVQSVSPYAGLMRYSMLERDEFRFVHSLN